MSRLHEVIYQIVAHPQLLADVTQNTGGIREKFNLSAGEAQALAVLSADGTAWQQLLSPETLRSATRDLLESLWVPPSLP